VQRKASIIARWLFRGPRARPRKPAPWRLLPAGTEAGGTSPVPPRLSPRSPMLRVAYQMLLFRPGRGKYLPVPL